MKAAIVILEIGLNIVETNEPIHRAAGDTDDADADACRAGDIRQALAVLRAASDGPIWPKPESAPFPYRVL